jgi:hypothetical protein
MPINVTCSGCEYHFLVGDEFAGRPGRCPECGNIIHVPDADEHPAQSEPEPEPHPFHAPHLDHPLEEFQLQSRRERDEGDRYQPDHHDDRRYRPRELTFDPHARAAKWQSVSHGLRNLMVAVSLLAVREMVGSAFLFVDGVRPAQPNDFGPRDQAMVIGTILIWTICLVLWVWGRVSCARVPYVPARRLALPAAIIAVMTGLSGVLGLILFTIGVLLVGQGNLNGLGIANLGVCALMPATCGFVIAESMGLGSQVRMGFALQDSSFARSSRTLLIVFIGLTTLSCCATVGLMAAVISEIDKAQKQQQRQQQANNPKLAPNPPQDKDPAPDNHAAPKDGVKKEAPAAKGAAPANPANGNAPPAQPQPDVDPKDHPEVVYAVRIFGLLLALVYAAASLGCLHFGRRAIQREVGHLIGDPHDRGHLHDIHH